MKSELHSPSVVLVPLQLLPRPASFPSQVPLIPLLSTCPAPGTTSHAYPLPYALLLDLISLFEFHKPNCCLWFPTYVLFFPASFPCWVPAYTAPSPCLVYTQPIPFPSCLQTYPHISSHCLKVWGDKVFQREANYNILQMD